MADNPELIIRQTLKEAKLSNDSARRAQIEKRLNIYNDDWVSIIKAELDKQFSEKTREYIKLMPDDSVNIPKRIINDISLVYQREARRAYVHGEGENAKEDENYKKIISNIPIDIIMQEANRMTNLCNESLIYVVPRDNIEYDILTPDQVEIFQDPEDSTKPLAILFYQTCVDTVDDTTIIRKVYWDIFGNHRIFDHNDQEIQKLENPYKDPDNKDRTILPFVILHKSYPKCDIWDRTGGNDLFSAAVQVAVLLTDLNYSMKVNSFKQQWMTGIKKVDAAPEVVLDPLYPHMNPSTDGKFGVLDFTVDQMKALNVIIGKIGLIANNWGLSLDNFKLTVSARSGFALRVENFALEKVVIEQKKFYRHYENEIFKVTKIVNNTINIDKQIKEDGQFIVDFSELLFPLDPEENRKQWAFDMKLGAKNILQYIMETNPDIKDTKQAEEFFLSNIKLNKEASTKAGIDINAILDSILKSSTSGGGSSSGGGEPSQPLI